MAFKDYPLAPADVETLGDATYVGPNMARNDVRPALQQLAADGRALYDYASSMIQSSYGPAYDTIEAGLAETAEGKAFLVANEDSTVSVYTKVGVAAVEKLRLDAGLRADLAAAEGSARVAFRQAGSGSSVRTAEDKLREGFWSAADYTSPPSEGSPKGVDHNEWFRLFVDPGLGTVGREYHRQYIPATVALAGGGAVQGAALIFEGETSAQTPDHNSIAETNVMRFHYHVKADAGAHLWAYLMNGMLISEHNAYDAAATGDFMKNTEGTCFLFTHRSIGPAAGAGKHAAGVWAADLHVEKSVGTAPGKMIVGEFGLHTGVTGNYADVNERMNGVEVWSGNRPGSVVTSGAVQAHDAIRVYGDGGWTKMFRAIHTDGVTDVFSIDKMGSYTATAPSGSILATNQTNQNNTGAMLQNVGRTSAGVNVQAILSADAGGQVTVGSNTNHDVVLASNAIEVVRVLADKRLRIAPRPDAPSGAAGDLYYDSGTNKHYGHNGTSWSALY